ncbi:hypothetical protein KIN20_002287 [Parelaphostrongylus tenuis]|uniref:Uncharacterized protein n=1 Tax=Parelaphostrongylus tenuis TaxID=148309 RepID=A0AAD5MGK1_PARTN|nr:hypothetical protein KIN20_002287 [Parelaphostrongylus tenuis]
MTDKEETSGGEQDDVSFLRTRHTIIAITRRESDKHWEVIEPRQTHAQNRPTFMDD